MAKNCAPLDSTTVSNTDCFGIGYYLYVKLLFAAITENEHPLNLDAVALTQTSLCDLLNTFRYTLKGKIFN